MLFNTIYVGYYVLHGHSYILCISDNVGVVKGYLTKIRGLSKKEYEIDEVTLDEATTYALYEDFIIEEYYDGIYVTRRDMDALDRELYSTLEGFVETYRNLTQYRDIIASIDGKMSNDIRDLDPAIRAMEKRLTSAKSLKKLQKQIVYSSDVLSPSINRYISQMGVYEEENEMRQMFLQRLNDPRA